MYVVFSFDNRCKRIIQDHSDYSLEISGCGLGPEKTYCTQMATFLRSASNEEQLSLNMDGKPCQNVPIVSMDSLEILGEYDFPCDTRTQEEQDRHHTLARLHALINFIHTGESLPSFEQLPESSAEEQCSQEQLLDSLSPYQFNTLSLSPLTLDEKRSEDEFSFFHAEYIKTEDSTSQKFMHDNDYCFHVVDDSYIVIPIKSLAAWVNVTADHKISSSLIRYV